MRITVCADTIVHIVTRPQGGNAKPAQPWLLPAAESCPGAHFDFAQDAKRATLKTTAITVSLALDKGNLTFATPDGKSFLREGNSLPRTYTPVTLNGEQTYHITDRFSPDATEAIYGLGQHQSGLFNYRGATVELGQNNTDIAIPMLVSTNGYGVMWNTASLTTMDNRFPLEIKLDSIAADGIDYFVLYGPEFDAIIHDYVATLHRPRAHAAALVLRLHPVEGPLHLARRDPDHRCPLPRRTHPHRHHGAGLVLVEERRRPDLQLKLPRRPRRPREAPCRALPHHDLHLGHDGSGGRYVQETRRRAPPPQRRARLRRQQPARPRPLLVQNLDGPLLAQGWDSFWLDSAEPEEYYPHLGDAILTTRTMAIGNGAAYTNIYPLLHNEGIQQNWRKTTDQKRVFLLTRSAFLGSQRVGGTVWSGDVYSSFWGLTHQVAGGLNYALSGLPYWTTDIGGYWPTMDLNSPEYQELYLRWFLFGSFNPVFRSHGHRPGTT